MSEISAQSTHNTPIGRGSSAPVPDKSRLSFYLYAALILALAALLRFLFIGRFEVWLDEAYCFAVARKPIAAILADLAFDNGPPLYYILLHYWMLAFGESALAMRSLSAVFSIATVAVVVFWDAPWLGRRARLWAGFVLAITPLAIYYGQETRMYSPVAFFVLVSMVFLERGLRLGKAREWVFCAVATALSLYTSYASVFVIPAGYLVVVAGYLATKDLAKFRTHFTGILAAHIAAAALFAFWLPTFFRQPSAAAVQWIGAMWDIYGWDKLPGECLLPLKSASVMTTGGAYYPPYLRNLRMEPERVETTREAIQEGRETRPLVKFLASIPPAAPLVLMALTAIALLIIAFWPSGGDFPYRTFLAGWVLLSFMLPFLMSLIRPMYVPGRYDLAGVPAFAVIQGIALSRLARRWRILAAGTLSVLFLYEYGYMQMWPSTEKFSPKARALGEIASKGDVIVGEAFECGQTYYHIGPVRDQFIWMTYPRETIKHFAWIDYDKWLQPGWEVPKEALRQEAEATIAEAVRLAAPGRAVIILRVGNPPTWADAMDEALLPAVSDAVDSGQLVADMEKSDGKMGVVVLRRPQEPPAAPGHPPAASDGKDSPE